MLKSDDWYFQGPVRATPHHNSVTAQPNSTWLGVGIFSSIQAKEQGLYDLALFL
jgi:hypothetical protein